MDYAWKRRSDLDGIYDRTPWFCSRCKLVDGKIEWHVDESLPEGGIEMFQCSRVYRHREAIDTAELERRKAAIRQAAAVEAEAVPYTIHPAGTYVTVTLTRHPYVGDQQREVKILGYQRSARWGHVLTGVVLVKTSEGKYETISAALIESEMESGAGPAGLPRTAAGRMTAVKSSPR